MAAGSSMLSGLIGCIRPARAPDATVDHDVGDVNALRRKLARHALGQPAQRELAHRERRRLRITLHARRRAGEQDRAVLVRQHSPRRLLGDEERTEGGDVERLLDVGGIEIDERAASAEARIVDHDVGRSEGAVDIGEQLVDLRALARVAVERPRPGFLHQRLEIVGAARRERDLDAVLGQRPCERGGES